MLLEHSQSVDGISPTYAAPEQFDSETFGPTDDFTDIYQLGAVVYALLAGEPPFTGTSTSVMRSVLDDEPAPPSAVESSLPAAVDDVVLQALAKRKGDRYESVVTFRQELDRLFEEFARGDKTTPASERNHTAGSETPETETREGRTAETDRDTDQEGTVETTSPDDHSPSTSHSSSTSQSSRQGESTASNTPTAQEGADSDDSSFVTRRRALGLLGVGVVGSGVVLSQMGGDDPPTNGRSESDDISGASGSDGGSTPTATESGGIDDSETPTDRPLPEPSGTYDVVTGTSYEMLNPLYNTEDGARRAIGFALEQGYTFDDQQQLVPLHYDLTTDRGQVWVFDVRENLQFSDPYGQVTAEDYVYQIQQLHQNDSFSTNYSDNWPSEYNVTQNSEFEFQVELPDTNILWPQTTEPIMYPIPKDLVQPYVEDEDVEGIRQDTELLELQFTGNLGGYTMDEWNRGSGTTYTRNEEYYARDIPNAPDIWGNAPYFEGASTSVVSERSARLGALETGEVDEADVPPSQYQEFADNDSVSVTRIPQSFNEKITMNMRDNGWSAGPGNLFRHIPFRQALAMAINKQDLIEGPLRNLAKPQYTWQPEFSRWYPVDADFPNFGQGDMYGADVAQERAQEAFGMSEYDYAFEGDTMVNPDGNQVTLDIHFFSNDDTDQLMAEFIAQELGNNLGMNVNVNGVTAGPWISDYVQFSQEERVEPGTSVEYKGKTFTWDAPSSTNPGPRIVTSNEAWDMAIVYKLNTYSRNPLKNNAYFDGASGSFNFGGYYPEFNASELFEQARNANSTEEVQSIFSELFVNVAEEQPYVMLVYPDSTVGYNSDLVGPIANFSNGWNFPAWRFEE
jgi:peptide/nickel transport system substrate-binding protein